MWEEKIHKHTNQENVLPFLYASTHAHTLTFMIFKFVQGIVEKSEYECVLEII